MMQTLLALTQRADAAAACAAQASATLFGFEAANAFGATGTVATTAWNAMPSVPTPAICTHGKRYEWRLREMPT